MTVWVTDGDGCDLFLWASSSDEALMAAATIGHALDQPFTRWDCYRLDWDQWARAVEHGATVTDRFEPALQLAEAEGRWETVYNITRLRGRSPHVKS